MIKGNTTTAMLTVKQLQAYLGLGRGTTYRLLSNQGIPSVRFGKRILIPVEVLKEYLRNEALQNTKGMRGR